MELKVYNTENKEVSTVEVSDSVFAVEYNEAVIHQVVVSQLANKRQGTKCTLTRTEVRGGGIKPWRQKGTGRARQGSIRSPQWRHGGVVFAPKPRDFSKKINKAVKAKAIKIMLSELVRTNNLVVLDKIEIAEPKTKLMANIQNTLNADAKSLFVLGSENKNVLIASKNIQEVSVCDAKLINVYDLAKADKVFVTVEAIKAIEEARA